MALLLDAEALYAQADRVDPHHAAVVDILHAEQGPLIASAIGVAEADYLILTRLGIDVELTFDERAFRNVRPLQGGSFTLLPADR
jgi:hypothetical protein